MRVEGVAPAGIAGPKAVVCAPEFGVSGFGFRVLGFGFRASVFGNRVSDFCRATDRAPDFFPLDLCPQTLDARP